MNRKTFVIDTNVLLHDPKALFHFPRHIIVIPMAVLEELDKMKRQPNEVGKNARECIRLLDDLRRTKKGSLHNGVKLDNDCTIRLEVELIDEPHKYNLKTSINDNRIILAAFVLKEKGEKVIFVSKDFAARIKAEAIGIALAIGFVWTAELFNTAIESLSDLVSKDHHPEIKFIKDVSAAAVLLSAIAAVITGAIIFIPKLFQYEGDIKQDHGKGPAAIEFVTMATDRFYVQFVVAFNKNN